jgi:hypothetical protein
MTFVILFEDILLGNEAEDSNGLIQDDVDFGFSFLYNSNEAIRETIRRLFR